MCTIVKKEYKITDKDMVVYKGLTAGMIAPVYYFKYSPHVTYESPINQELQDDWSTADIVAENSLRDNDYNPDKPHRDLICLGEGFHSCTTMERAIELNYSTCVFRCVIPEGSIVYEDFSGLLVSNKIIIKELVFQKKLEYVLNNTI